MRNALARAGLIRLSDTDNCYVITQDLAGGEEIAIDDDVWVVPSPLTIGHKIAVAPLAEGVTVIKFGVPIGTASRAIAKFEHIHLHNLKSTYIPTHQRGDFSTVEED